jgi:Zn-dependent protease with chaperone function
MLQPLLTSGEIRAAFPRSIRRIAIAPGYRLRLLAILLGLGALQCLYLLLIAVVILMTVILTVVVFASGMRPNFLTIIVYAAPPAVGIITTLFLLKPILIRPPRAPEPVQLRREDEPVLFEFVDSLCRTLGSPRPSRIYVDLQANAAAGVRGWRGFFLGHLQLTIGLPLATGLTLPQFAGVLAHEFGHFAQRAGLRSYFLFQSIQNWFARVVHQRDRWDQWLAEHCERGDWRIKAVANLAAVVVAASRKYLSLLMTAGNWLSASFSRHMEFDADRYETAIVGAGVFEQTMLRLPLLSYGESLAWQDVARHWSIGRLPDDLTALVAAQCSNVPPETAEQITRHVLAAGTARRDTHPSAADRIASVRRAAVQGEFELDGSAARLFRDLSALSRLASRHHYERNVQIPADFTAYVSSDELVSEMRVVSECNRAAWQLFNAAPEFCARWFRLPLEDPRDTIPAPSDFVYPLFDVSAYDAALARSLDHFAAVVLLQAGVGINPVSFSLDNADLPSVQRAAAASSRDLDALLQGYRRASMHLAEWIERTIAGFRQGTAGLAVPGGSLMIPDPRSVWRCYGRLCQCQEDLLQVRRFVFAAQIVRGNAGLFAAAACANLLDALERQALSIVDRVLAKVGDTPATVILDRRSAPTLCEQLVTRGAAGLDRIQSLLSRAEILSAGALGQLAWITLA